MRDSYISFSVPSISKLAILFVVALIIFLAYTPQYLFIYFEPGILSKAQKSWFNLFVFFIWWCYYRTCTIDAAPQGWVSKAVSNTNNNGGKLEEENIRWCKKCQCMKPPRAHHCKKCAKCIPKMDHHCPWTSNYTTLFSMAKPPYSCISRTTHMGTPASIGFTFLKQCHSLLP